MADKVEDNSLDNIDNDSSNVLNSVINPEDSKKGPDAKEEKLDNDDESTQFCDEIDKNNVCVKSKVAKVKTENEEKEKENDFANCDFETMIEKTYIKTYKNSELTDEEKCIVPENCDWGDSFTESFLKGETGDEQNDLKQDLSIDPSEYVEVNLDISEPVVEISTDIEQDQTVTDNEPNVIPVIQKCYLCNKTFEINVIEFTDTTQDENPQFCEYCQNRINMYNMSDNFDDKDVQTDKKCYVCEICNETFRYISHLKTHKRIHLGWKVYTCAVCNKAFSYISSLNLHKRSHTGEKSYDCNICNKRYLLYSRFTAHRCKQV